MPVELLVHPEPAGEVGVVSPTAEPVEDPLTHADAPFFGIGEPGLELADRPVVRPTDVDVAEVLGPLAGLEGAQQERLAGPSVPGEEDDLGPGPFVMNFADGPFDPLAHGTVDVEVQSGDGAV